MRLIKGLAQPASAPEAFVHVEFPLVQRWRPVRGFLLSGEDAEVERLVCDRRDDLRVESTAEGLLLYARHEDALKGAGARLRCYRFRHLAPDPPQARVRPDPLRAPWMHVHVRGPRRFAALARDELFRRQGRTGSAEFFGDVVMLSGQAPLAGLVGYADWVRERTDGRLAVETRLAAWRLVDADPDPPGPLAA
jgi:hypothetical protein